MRRRTWLLWLVLWAPLCAQQVAFERGFYSFEAIAQKLSVGGRQVVCEPALKQRMALLSLKARDWEKMCQLLQQGLDLEIVCVDAEKNRWRLQRDRQVVAREKQLRTRLAEVIEARLLGKQPARYPNWFLLLSSLPPEITITELQALQTWLEEFEVFQKKSWASESFEGMSLPEILAQQLADFGTAPDCPMLTRWAREQATLPRAEFLRRFGTYFGELMLSLEEERRVQYILLAIAEGLRASPEILLLAQVRSFLQSRLPLRAAILRAIEQGEVIQVDVLPPAIGALVPDREKEEAINPAQGDPVSSCLATIPPYTCVAIYSVEMDDYDLAFQINTYIFVGSRHAPLFMKDDNGKVSINATTKELSQLFKEMDESLCTQYEEATRLHRLSIQAPRYQIPIDLTIKRRFPNGEEVEYEADSFYVFLDRFSKRYQQEVIAEVYPHRGALDLDPEGDRRVPLIKVDLLMVSEGAWRVEQVDGVWVWRNWLAFVDRVPDFPLAALHQLVFSSRTPADWRRFAQQTTPNQARWLMRADTLPEAGPLFGSGTEGLGQLRCVGKQWLLFRLLELIPSWEKRLHQAGKLESSLGQLPVLALRRWAAEGFPIPGKRILGDGLDDSWVACTWLGSSEAFAGLLQQVGRLRLTQDEEGLLGEVLLEDKALIGCPLPINLPKQR